MTRLKNDIKNLKASKYILAFKIPYGRNRINSLNGIKLPRGEQWTIHFAEKWIYIEFGRRTSSGSYKYNLNAITRFKHRVKNAKIGIWTILDDTNRLDSIVPRFNQEEDSSQEEYFDPSTKTFCSDRTYPGDSLPTPRVSKAYLDKQLDEMVVDRERFFEGYKF